MVDAIPLSYSANNWFSIHRKPGVDWEGRLTKKDRKHKVIEEFYDPIDSARAITRSLLSRGFRIGANGFLPIKNLFNPDDAYGAYAKDTKPYLDTLQDFGYTEDSVVDLSNKRSLGKFLDYLAAIEMGREFYKTIPEEEKQKVIQEGIQKGYDSLLTDKDYKYKDELNKLLNRPKITVEFEGDKDNMQQGGFIRKPQIINDPSAAPASMRADDVDLQAQEGDFIVGYPAMQQNGPRVRSLVEQAMLRAKDAGVKTKGYKRGDKVDILAHNGEMQIPNQLIPYIEGGYATLKKLNQPSKYDEGGFVDKMAMLREGEQQQQEEFTEQREQEFEQDPRSKAIAGVTREEEQLERIENIEQEREAFSGVHSDYKTQLDTMGLQKDYTDYKFSVPPPESGHSKFNLGEYKNTVQYKNTKTDGEKFWENLDKRVRKHINKKLKTIDKNGKKNFHQEVMNNYKMAIEANEDNQMILEDIATEKYIEGTVKGSLLHRILNRTNYLKKGNELNNEIIIGQDSLKFTYPDGTADVLGINQKEKQYFDRHPSKLKYSSDESTEKDDEYLSRELQIFKDKNNYNINQDPSNSAGTLGYLGAVNGEEVDFPEEYEFLVDYLKNVENNPSNFNPNIYKDEGSGRWSIGFGHNFTEKSLKKFMKEKEITNKNDLVISIEEAEDLLRKDILAAEQLASDIYGNFIKNNKKAAENSPQFQYLDNNRKMMIIEYVFNMGHRFNDYDDFLMHLTNNDYRGMLSEYKRGFYEDRVNKSGFTELESRNNDFLNTFLKPNLREAGNNRPY